jgi:hypothetical protein
MDKSSIKSVKCTYDDYESVKKIEFTNVSNETTSSRAQKDTFSIGLKDPALSSTWNAANSADKALDGNKNTLVASKLTDEVWWKASFVNGEHYVTEVQIQNRRDTESFAKRLGGTEITIGGKACGKLPDNTPFKPDTDHWWTVKCASPILGSDVKLQDKVTHLNFTQIKVIGYKQIYDEKCSGELCSGYRGTQNKTVSGKSCQAWTGVNSTNCPDPATCKNYCRNPAPNA